MTKSHIGTCMVTIIPYLACSESFLMHAHCARDWHVTTRNVRTADALVRGLRSAGFFRPVESHSGAWENILPGPQTFSRGPSGKKIFEFFFQNGTFWHTLYFWPTVGPQNVAGPGLLTPYPTLSTGLGFFVDAD